MYVCEKMKLGCFVMWPVICLRSASGKFICGLSLYIAVKQTGWKTTTPWQPTMATA